MIIFVFLNFLAFWSFPWQGSHFEKNQPLQALLIYHSVWQLLGG
jgi:hypothetical protein